MCGECTPWHIPGTHTAHAHTRAHAHATRFFAHPGRSDLLNPLAVSSATRRSKQMTGCSRVHVSEVPANCTTMHARKNTNNPPGTLSQVADKPLLREMADFFMEQGITSVQITYGPEDDEQEGGEPGGAIAAPIGVGGPPMGPAGTARARELGPGGVAPRSEKVASLAAAAAAERIDSEARSASASVTPSVPVEGS